MTTKKTHHPHKSPRDDDAPLSPEEHLSPAQTFEQQTPWEPVGASTSAGPLRVSSSLKDSFLALIDALITRCTSGSQLDLADLRDLRKKVEAL